MSASSKKKLRREQESAKLTEKQITARKEAKKTSLYTICFVAVMVILLVVAITIGISQTVTSSGIREKNTTALTVGQHKISNAELNYYYVDAINNFMSQYGSYAAMFGLDTTKALDEQFMDEETGTTWADNFLDSAKANVKDVYAIYDAAQAAGFVLSEEDQISIETNLGNLEGYAMIYGFSKADDYLKAMYGNGASLESFEKYMEMTTTYTAYQHAYSEALTYDEAALKAADGENYDAYRYNTYYIGASRFAGEDGEVTEANVTAAEEAAKSLVGEGNTTAEALDAAIAALEINKDTSASAITHEDTLYTSVSSVYADWITDASRKEGDVSYFASTSTSQDEDGKEVTTTSGYTVVLYLGSEDNQFALKNVRHILVSFQGGTTDETTGVTTYSDAEKTAAKLDAEAVLSTWESGEKTEDAFAALAKEKSTDPGSASEGGLYENVYPGQMVASFNDWCFDESRKAGDTGIVETEYGYHVMYFAGDSDLTYRNYLIENDLRSADVESWYTGLVDAVTVTEGDIKYIDKSLVLNSAA